MSSNTTYENKNNIFELEVSSVPSPVLVVSSEYILGYVSEAGQLTCCMKTPDLFHDSVWTLVINTENLKMCMSLHLKTDALFPFLLG